MKKLTSGGEGKTFFKSETDVDRGKTTSSVVFQNENSYFEYTPDSADAAGIRTVITLLPDLINYDVTYPYIPSFSESNLTKIYLQPFSQIAIYDEQITDENRILQIVKGMRVKAGTFDTYDENPPLNISESLLVKKEPRPWSFSNWQNDNVETYTNYIDRSYPYLVASRFASFATDSQNNTYAIWYGTVNHTERFILYKLDPQGNLLAEKVLNNWQALGLVYEDSDVYTYSYQQEKPSVEKTPYSISWDSSDYNDGWWHYFDKSSNQNQRSLTWAGRIQYGVNNDDNSIAGEGPSPYLAGSHFGVGDFKDSEKTDIEIFKDILNNSLPTNFGVSKNKNDGGLKTVWDTDVSFGTINPKIKINSRDEIFISADISRWHIGTVLIKLNTDLEEIWTKRIHSWKYNYPMIAGIGSGLDHYGFNSIEIPYLNTPWDITNGGAEYVYDSNGNKFIRSVNDVLYGNSSYEGITVPAVGPFFLDLEYARKNPHPFFDSSEINFAYEFSNQLLITTDRRGGSHKDTPWYWPLKGFDDSTGFNTAYGGFDSSFDITRKLGIPKFNRNGEIPFEDNGFLSLAGSSRLDDAALLSDGSIVLVGGTSGWLDSDHRQDVADQLTSTEFITHEVLVANVHDGPNPRPISQDPNFYERIRYNLAFAQTTMQEQAYDEGQIGLNGFYPTSSVPSSPSNYYDSGDVNFIRNENYVDPPWLPKPYGFVDRMVDYRIHGVLYDDSDWLKGMGVDPDGEPSLRQPYFFQTPMLGLGNRGHWSLIKLDSNGDVDYWRLYHSGQEYFDSQNDHFLLGTESPPEYDRVDPSDRQKYYNNVYGMRGSNGGISNQLRLGRPKGSTFGYEDSALPSSGNNWLAERPVSGSVSDMVKGVYPVRRKENRKPTNSFISYQSKPSRIIERDGYLYVMNSIVYRTLDHRGPNAYFGLNTPIINRADGDGEAEDITDIAAAEIVKLVESSGEVVWTRYITGDVIPTADQYQTYDYNTNPTQLNSYGDPVSFIPIRFEMSADGQHLYLVDPNSSAKGFIDAGSLLSSNGFTRSNAPLIVKMDIDGNLINSKIYHNKKLRGTGHEGGVSQIIPLDNNDIVTVSEAFMPLPSTAPDNLPPPEYTSGHDVALTVVLWDSDLTPKVGINISHGDVFDEDEYTWWYDYTERNAFGKDNSGNIIISGMAVDDDLYQVLNAQPNGFYSQQIYRNFITKLPVQLLDQVQNGFNQYWDQRVDSDNPIGGASLGMYIYSADSAGDYNTVFETYDGKVHMDSAIDWINSVQFFLPETRTNRYKIRTFSEQSTIGKGTGKHAAIVDDTGNYGLRDFSDAVRPGHTMDKFITKL